MSEAVRFEGVTKRFGSAEAVSDLNLTIEQGEFFSLLGPSGCGKTTTLRMVAGFEQPSEGEVFLDGEPVATVPPYKRNVNTVFQQYALFPHMTVADNVAFGPRSKGVSRSETDSRVKEMLDIVRLAEFASRRPTQLSGGQQQRVALARALVNYPSALLLDEPLAALDLKLREAMQLELKRIQREVGITFVFVTHDQGEALTMSDRIAVMSEGVVEQVGTPEEIYHRPASLFVAGFIGSANLLPGTAVDSDGDDVVVKLECGPTVRASMGREPSNGDPVSVMIRPERLRVTLEPGVDGRTIEGMVRSMIFQGCQIRLDVQLGDGTDIVSWIDPDDDFPHLRPGSDVQVTWNPGAAYLLAGWPQQAGANDTNVDQIEAAL